jgi:hypothetical protein
MAKYEIKIIASGGKEAADAIKNIGETADKTEKATTKLTEKTFKANEAFKKLGQAVPAVGGVLEALKNPFTTFGLLSALAVRSINDFISAVDRMAESVQAVEGLQGKVERFFEVIAQEKVEADAFAERLRAIATNSKDAAEWLKEVNAQIERKFDLEAKNDPNGDPAVREKRKTVAKAEAADAAARRAREDAALAQSALPGARETLTEERKAAVSLVNRLGAQDRDAAAREEFLIDQNKEIKDNLGRNPLWRRRLSSDPLYTSRSTEELQAQLELNRNELNMIGAGRSLRAADRMKAQGRVSSAEKVVTGLEGRVVAGLESARGFEADADIGFANAKADPTSLTMGGPELANQFTQRRHDTIQQLRASLLESDRETLAQLQQLLRDSAEYREAIRRLSQNSQ